MHKTRFSRDKVVTSKIKEVLSFTMKLAVVTGIEKVTNLESKGGMEMWTANFVLENARRNHLVDLFAVQGSIQGQNVNLIPSIDRVLEEHMAEKYFTEHPEQSATRKEQFMSTIYTRVLKDLKQREEEYDIIVDSICYPSFSSNVGIFRKPVLSICHFPADFTPILCGETRMAL